MTFPHINRRTHLYLGLFLLPWFVLYGVSSIPFSHPAWGNALYDDGVPQWTTRVEKTYDLQLPPDADRRAIGAALIRETGSSGAFGVGRPGPKRVNVYVYTFRKATQIQDDFETKQLRAQDRRFRWDQWLTGFHARGGFAQENPLNDAWGVIVDVVCAGFLMWIASGLYRWWKLPRQRGWGWVALGAGAATFTGFLLLL